MKSENKNLRSHKKRLGKKGFAYLLTASILISIILIVYLTAYSYKHQDKQDAQSARIHLMDDFIKGFDQDISRATHITAFRTMIALEDSIATTGKFLNNTEESFKETFYYGTVNGSASQIMNESSFETYITKVMSIANDMGFETSINVTNITLTQNDPWHINVGMTALIVINDSNHLASWTFTKQYSTDVPIADLRDPLYSSFTEGKVPNTVREFNKSYFVSSTNDTTNLLEHLNNSDYYASAQAPDFLMRFENNYSPSPYGIESFVNINELNAQNLPVDQNAVKIDYIYFNNLATDKICNVQNIPSDYYFVVPSNRISLYDLNNLNYTTPCS